jgi:Rad3-related DNA helicase
MTEAQIMQAAKLAISAMDEATRAAFIAAFEAGNETVSGAIATGYAVEGVSRQIRMCSMALESGRVMDGLCDLVCDVIAA